VLDAAVGRGLTLRRGVKHVGKEKEKDCLFKLNLINEENEDEEEMFKLNLISLVCVKYVGERFVVFTEIQRELFLREDVGSFYQSTC